jgi:hypothetical protein
MFSARESTNFEVEVSKTTMKGMKHDFVLS